MQMEKRKNETFAIRNATQINTNKIQIKNLK